MKNSLPTVTIIIPTLNEEKALPATLHSISKQTQAADEVIVVDGGSEDKTYDIAQQYSGIQWLESRHKGRAQQMNIGANKASSRWLLFLHADTLLPKDAIANIKQLGDSDSVNAGCFKHQFSSPNWLLQFISCLHHLRFRVTGIMYGDQSIFCQRDTFLSLKGYPEAVMEDIRFSENLLASNTTPILLNSYITTDSRKFKQRGILRSLLDVIIIVSCYQLKRPIPNFSQSFFSEIR